MKSVWSLYLCLQANFQCDVNCTFYENFTLLLDLFYSIFYCSFYIVIDSCKQPEGYGTPSKSVNKINTESYMEFEKVQGQIAKGCYGFKVNIAHSDDYWCSLDCLVNKFYT